MKNSAVFLVFFTLAVAAYALPDCPAGYNDQYGCIQWKNEGDCDPASQWYTFMQGACKIACGFCQAPPTAAPPPTTAPPPPQNVNVDSNPCLAAHNAKRSLHGVPNLSWDANLATEAAAWALHLAQTNTFEHGSGNFGENLYMSMSSTVGNCQDAVQSWYDEIKDYDYNNPVFSSATGHFTQVVWKSTTNLGVGIATATVDGSTKTFVVARYTPAGNMIGQFSENVLPLV